MIRFVRYSILIAIFAVGTCLCQKILITDPNAASVWTLGAKESVTFSSEGIITTNVSVSVCINGKPYGSAMSLFGRSLQVNTIDNVVLNASTLKPKQDFTVSLCDPATGFMYDTSSPFALVAASLYTYTMSSSAGVLQVIRGFVSIRNINQNTVWTRGTTVSVRWFQQGFVGDFSIYVRINNRQYTNLVSIYDLITTFYLDFDVPVPDPQDTFSVSLCDVDGAVLTTSIAFTLLPGATPTLGPSRSPTPSSTAMTAFLLTIVKPNLTTIWTVDRNVTVRWSTTNINNTNTNTDTADSIPVHVSFNGQRLSSDAPLSAQSLSFFLPIGSIELSTLVSISLSDPNENILAVSQPFTVLEEVVFISNPTNFSFWVMGTNVTVSWVFSNPESILLQLDPLVHIEIDGIQYSDNVPLKDSNASFILSVPVTDVSKVVTVQLVTINGDILASSTSVTVLAPLTATPPATPTFRNNGPFRILLPNRGSQWTTGTNVTVRILLSGTASVEVVHVTIDGQQYTDPVTILADFSDSRAATHDLVFYLGYDILAPRSNFSVSIENAQGFAVTSEPFTLLQGPAPPPPPPPAFSPTPTPSSFGVQDYTFTFLEPTRSTVWKTGTVVVVGWSFFSRAATRRRDHEEYFLFFVQFVYIRVNGKRISEQVDFGSGEIRFLLKAEDVGPASNMFLVQLCDQDGNVLTTSEAFTLETGDSQVGEPSPTVSPTMAPSTNETLSRTQADVILGFVTASLIISVGASFLTSLTYTSNAATLVSSIETVPPPTLTITNVTIDTGGGVITSSSSSYTPGSTQTLTLSPHSPSTPATVHSPTSPDTTTLAAKDQQFIAGQAANSANPSPNPSPQPSPRLIELKEIHLHDLSSPHPVDGHIAVKGGVTSAPAPNGVTSAQGPPNGVTSAPATPNGVTSAPPAPNGMTSAPPAPNGVTSAPPAPNGMTSAPPAPNGMTIPTDAINGTPTPDTSSLVSLKGSDGLMTQGINLVPTSTTAPSTYIMGLVDHLQFVSTTKYLPINLSESYNLLPNTFSFTVLRSNSPPVSDPTTFQASDADNSLFQALYYFALVLGAVFVGHAILYAILKLVERIRKHRYPLFERLLIWPKYELLVTFLSYSGICLGASVALFFGSSTWSPVGGVILFGYGLGMLLLVSFLILRAVITRDPPLKYQLNPRSISFCFRRRSKKASTEEAKLDAEVVSVQVDGSVVTTKSVSEKNELDEKMNRKRNGIVHRSLKSLSSVFSFGDRLLLGDWRHIHERGERIIATYGFLFDDMRMPSVRAVAMSLDLIKKFGLALFIGLLRSNPIPQLSVLLVIWTVHSMYILVLHPFRDKIENSVQFITCLFETSIFALAIGVANGNEDIVDVMNIINIISTVLLILEQIRVVWDAVVMFVAFMFQLSVSAFRRCRDHVEKRRAKRMAEKDQNKRKDTSTPAEVHL